jgi:hypothetical protein
MTEGWRKLYDEELHMLYSFTKYNYNDQVKEDEMGRVYNTHKKKRNIYIGFCWGSQERERRHKTYVGGKY